MDMILETLYLITFTKVTEMPKKPWKGSDHLFFSVADDGSLVSFETPMRVVHFAFGQTGIVNTGYDLVLREKDVKGECNGTYNLAKIQEALRQELGEDFELTERQIQVYELVRKILEK